MSGHVFVVNGKIEELVHDAAVVPTDSWFTVEKHWEPLLGGKGKRLEPAGWKGGGFARSVDKSSVWFVDVGDASKASVGPAGLAARLRLLLNEISGAELLPADGRVLPLIALPVLAIGEGGLNHQRGDVIVKLLEALTEFVEHADIDVALVTPDRAVCAAVQHKRRELKSASAAGCDEMVTAKTLGELASRGHLALLIGAGASIPAGLPSWGELIDLLCEGREPAFVERIRDLDQSPLDQAELLARVAAGSLGEAVAKAMDREVRPSLAHALLAGLRCREALTTNYDNLYERAVAAAGTGGGALGSVPATVGDPVERWLLKMHGSLDDPGSIILTRRDFVQYDARVKPAASVLQAVALTRHMLMVGLSMKDDNVVRLLLEVDEYRKASATVASTEPFATLLDVSGDTARAELWKGQVTWLRMGDGELPKSARELEIFLDAVSMYACQDASWLLDERFAGMLTPSQQALASRSRDLLRDIEKESGKDDGWSALANSLKWFGAPQEQ
jgi:hypothetical protein